MYQGSLNTDNYLMLIVKKNVFQIIYTNGIFLYGAALQVLFCTEGLYANLVCTLNTNKKYLHI